MRRYFVYIMPNRSGTLYTGIASDLERRVYEHKNKLLPGFTSRYNINMLVHYGETNEVEAALAREQQIKGRAGPARRRSPWSAQPTRPLLT